MSRSTLQRRVRAGRLHPRREPITGRALYARSELEALAPVRRTAAACAATPDGSAGTAEPFPSSAPPLEPPPAPVLERVLRAFEDNTPLFELVREGFEPGMLTHAAHYLSEHQARWQAHREATRREQLRVSLDAEDLRYLAGFLSGPPLRDRESLREAVRVTITELWAREEALDALDHGVARPSVRTVPSEEAATS